MLKCPDSLAQSYCAHATSGTGAVPEIAENKKLLKYKCLAPSHMVMLVAIETLGAVGPSSLAFLKDLGNRLKRQSWEEKAQQYLLQQLLVAVRTAVSVRGTVSVHSGDSFYLACIMAITLLIFITLLFCFLFVGTVSVCCKT